jgi:hypothetical protein
MLSSATSRRKKSAVVQSCWDVGGVDLPGSRLVRDRGAVAEGPDAIEALHGQGCRDADATALVER